MLGLKSAKTDKTEEEPKERKASGKPDEEDAKKLIEIYKDFFKRQAKSVLPKIGAGKEWWDEERWNRELADDLFAKAMGISVETARRSIEQLWEDGEYDSDRTEAYIRKMCERRAEMVNQATHEEIKTALESSEDEEGLKTTPEGVFENAEKNRSESAGNAFACALYAWSLLEACRQNKRRGENVMKTWRTTSGNPRSSHAAMDGGQVI